MSRLFRTKACWVFLFPFLILGCCVGEECPCEGEECNSCNSDHISCDIEPKTQDHQLNISIFLDLSNRISPDAHPNPTMDYFQRDTGYINSVVEAFQCHLLFKKVNSFDDRIKVLIDPPPTNQSTNSILSSLNFKFTKEEADMCIINYLDTIYDKKVSEIYASAISDANYVGSDIWGLFKNKLYDGVLLEDYRNILVILTDGFAYHKDNLITEGKRTSFLSPKRIVNQGLNNSSWETTFTNSDFGFITSINSLDDLEVLVIGINTYDGGPYQEDVVRAYWTKWFDEMGVSRYQIKSAVLPSEIDESIKRFILQP